MYYFLAAVIILSTSFEANAQVDTATTRNGAIKGGIGVGYNDTNEEKGLGLISSIGYQKEFGAKHKLRINPNLLFGSFSSAGITDTRDQYYQMSALQVILAYDVIRFKSISLFLSTGGVLTYSRGLFGTGDELEKPGTTSRYFNKIYLGGIAGAGIRISPQNSRLSYEINPLNFGFGNNGFILTSPILSLDYKL
ncbi:hypothetical protein I2I05_10940 [Hymenobacter sp. BT683]|uniref:Outer membrane protein beta-barrel domain-containing protein n=1 Tax=Hymenobacter jeongseonensis TaxID=2791027 RepID=A0ABS0IHT4_9BACT|nr:hypothetical protein [Hymenobacter jeongseonensis]MBF9237910.1 hypothetical protein [Hymenobacter jeongseonensis]